MGPSGNVLYLLYAGFLYLFFCLLTCMSRRDMGPSGSMPDRMVTAPVSPRALPDTTRSRRYRLHLRPRASACHGCRVRFRVRAQGLAALEAGRQRP